MKQDNSQEQTPYADIVEYGERYGLEALGLAILDIARQQSVEMTWELAQEVWEYGGRSK